MSNINELILIEQVQKQTRLDQKIQNIQAQNKHLSQLLPIHKQNAENIKKTQSNNSDSKKEMSKKDESKKEESKLYRLPTSKEMKASRTIGKIAYKLLDLNKGLI